MTNEQRIRTRLDRIKRAQAGAFTSALALKAPQRLCGTRYEYQPHGSGTRYHCPSCNVRRNGYGLLNTNWTNGHSPRRFCNNLTN